MKLAFIYALLAAVATIVNITTQHVFLEIYTDKYAIQGSVLCGTMAGLVVKYLLDKNYIFNFKTKCTAHNTKTFVLYSMMGVLTTAIFWMFEFIFHKISDGSAVFRYLGGTLGLIIGYIAKYQLDKKFVFKARQ
ncbi:GtrA family protein [Acidovorax sp. DW039]|uniref:GtrA family protein n=1 Tax=Acidovorax sp. DW039 TaxID=3095606 RepID=UPI00308618E0|nr:GtrA family protein [Acidovorax sp. DW039]